MSVIDGTYVAFETPAGASVYTSYRPRPITGNYDSGGGSGATTTYRHRAWNTVLTQFVYWSYTAEDGTGAHSGYDPVDLADIVLLSVN